MLSTEQRHKLTKELQRVRSVDKAIGPHTNHSQDFWHATGYLAAMFDSGAIDPGEYVRLSELAGNAFMERAHELSYMRSCDKGLVRELARRLV